MIIMINGTFGVGKSSVAEALLATSPTAMIYDPEIMGEALRYLTKGVLAPEETTDDFQDIALWPEISVLMAERLHRQYGRDLIVPMTLANRRYLETIRAGLAAITPPLYQFCLLAPLETVEKRLKGRDEDTTWTMNKARRYVPMFSDPAYGVQINTEDRSIDEIVAEIKSYIADNPTCSSTV